MPPVAAAAPERRRSADRRVSADGGGGAGHDSPAQHRRSSNVPVTLLFKSLDGLASGIWASGATSAYILLLLDGSGASATEAIGAAQALQGLALAACALPLAWAADTLGRARVARFSGALALAAAALTSAAVLWPARASAAAADADAGGGGDWRASYRLLCGALAVWGAAAGVGPTVDALFADSLPTGRRASWFQLAYALSLASRAVGPLVAALMFYNSGDSWSLPVLRRVILAGQVVSALPAAALFLLRDDAALGEESEGLLASSSRLPSAAAAGCSGDGGGGDGAGGRGGVGNGGVGNGGVGGGGGRDSSSDGVGDASAFRNGVSSRTPSSLSEPLLPPAPPPTMGVVIEDAAEDRRQQLRTQAEGEQRQQQQQEIGGGIGGGGGVRRQPRALQQPQRPPGRRGCLSFSFLRQRHVPLILATTDLVGGLASGMTVKFFAVFLIEQVELPPTSVNLMQASAPLLVALASAAAAKGARRLGRVQAMLAAKAAGVALLFWLALDRRMWARPAAVAAVYLARTALMNATYPLSRSVLSDYVSKKRRARWNALEAVTAMSWSGSAFLGGWVIERRGFGAAFFATAALQAVALAGQLLLLPLVPRREGGVLAGVAAAVVAAAAGG